MSVTGSSRLEGVLRQVCFEMLTHLVFPHFNVELKKITMFLSRNLAYISCICYPKTCMTNTLMLPYFWAVTWLCLGTEAVTIVQCLAIFRQRALLMLRHGYYGKILNGSAFPKLNVHTKMKSPCGVAIQNKNVHFKFILRFNIHGLGFNIVIKF